MACTEITGDFDRVVAIEVLGAASRQVEEGDTLRLRARAVSAAGDTVPDAPIRWVVLDVDSGQVGFTVDSLSGLVSAISPGGGRVQARVENLTSGAIQITVLPAPDSVAAVGAVRVTVDTNAVSSPPLAVIVYDLTTSPGTPLGLAGKAVEFATVDPVPGSAAADGFFLTQTDTLPGADPHRVETATTASGEASIVVRRTSGVAQPDSAIIESFGLTARRDTVAGSPVRFVVLFQNN